MVKLHGIFACNSKGTERKGHCGWGKLQSSTSLKRDDYLRRISDHLGRISHQVEVRNQISLFDLNIVAEDFYRDFLNKVYGLNLSNLNEDESNAKAVDLGDRRARIAIQVTSDNTIGKIRETVDKFEQDSRQEEFDQLTVLMLKKKKGYRDLPAPADFTLVVKDHLDLIEDVKRELGSVQLLKELLDYLDEELVFSTESRSSADAQILNTFSDNATRHIASVAELIVAEGSGHLPRQDLENSDLLEKFLKMRCSPSYRRKFDRHAAFFSNVVEIIESDGVVGGATTIRVIIGLIENIYFEVLEQSVNGDRIHNQILAALLEKRTYTPEQSAAAETLIFFTINECGIFNETK